MGRLWSSQWPDGWMKASKHRRRWFRPGNRLNHGAMAVLQSTGWGHLTTRFPHLAKWCLEMLLSISIHRVSDMAGLSVCLFTSMLFDSYSLSLEDIFSLWSSNVTFLSSGARASPHPVCPPQFGVPTSTDFSIKYLPNSFKSLSLGFAA